MHHHFHPRQLLSWEEFHERLFVLRGWSNLFKARSVFQCRKHRFFSCEVPRRPERATGSAQGNQWYFTLKDREQDWSVALS